METDRSQVIGQLFDLLQETWQQVVDKRLDESVWRKGAYKFSFLTDGPEFSGGQLEKNGQVVYATSHFPNLITRLEEI